MTRELSKIPEIVYHGTSYNHYESLKNGIALNKGRNNLDFGKGFYTTSSLKQAQKWAEQKVRKEKNYNNINTKPLIVTYKVDVKKLSALNKNIFVLPNTTWADYVAKMRNRQIQATTDFTYGHLADSKVLEHLEDYIENKISLQEFCNEIQPKHPEYEDQLVFHTQLSINCLERSD